MLGNNCAEHVISVIRKCIEGFAFAYMLMNCLREDAKKRIRRVHHVHSSGAKSVESLVGFSQSLHKMGGKSVERVCVYVCWSDV